MPATYAHYVFGEKVLRRQPADIRRLIEGSRELYDIGLHGPDILFYFKPLGQNPVNRQGYAMHERPGEEFFARAASLVRQQEPGEAGGLREQEPGEADSLRERQTAYLLGFLCHFALDSTCHGYIEKKIHVSGASHTEIETEFDRKLMEDAGLDPGKFFPAGHIVPSAANAGVIAPFFPGVEAGQVRKALSSLRFYSRLLMVPGEAKRRFLHGALRLVGKYEQLQGWVLEKEPRPACVDSSLRLEKLMDKAVPLCLELTANYCEVLAGRGRLAPEFQKTFGAGEDWMSIPVLPLEEEQTYEVSADEA